VPAATALIPVPAPFPVPPIVARSAAELKNTVCVAEGHALYLSPHIGDLKTPGNQEFFTDTIAHLREVLGVAPRYGRP